MRPRYLLAERAEQSRLLDEMEAVTGISESNQRVLLHRARPKVRQALAPYMAPLQ